ncbi:MAG TPA: ubiquitin-conjugating enzyme E2 [Tepidisphaeraceae bacterium]|jgi:ubiquitin-protein ligase/DNA-directed RNA polymerase subunit RPC12/RpoP
MIDFSCTGCGERFSVPDNAANRNVRCKKCGKQLIIPAPKAAAPVAPGMTPMRLRRLKSDHEQMRRAFSKWPHIRVESTVGDPPETYVLEYTVRGLEKVPKVKDPVPREKHRVEVQLVSEYPRVGPKCRMLTPIYHPNIDPATICVGDHWTAGERLVDLVVRIGEMIAYQSYNIQSPLNGEAAMWTDLNTKSLPIDPRTIRPPEMG